MTSTATRRTATRRPASGPSKSGSLPPPPSPVSAGAYPAAPSASARPRTGGRTQQGSQQPAEPVTGPAEPVTGPAGPVTAPAPAPAARTGGGMAEQASGALLALFLWPLLLNLVRGGPAQMWGWIKAKWTNQPYGAAAPPGGTTAPAVSTAALQQLQQPGTAQQLAGLGINPQQAANALLQGTS